MQEDGNVLTLYFQPLDVLTELADSFAQIWQVWGARRKAFYGSLVHFYLVCGEMMRLKCSILDRYRKLLWYDSHRCAYCLC